MTSPDTRWDPDHIQWVMKVSKLCNLRCVYCYEYPFLAERGRMELGQLRRMFEQIAEYYRAQPRRMDFAWHGGEPLLNKADYYWRISEMQHEIFDPVSIPFTNGVQTNLTVLSADILDLCRRFFRSVGVSLDVAGDLRVTQGGQQVQPIILRNIERLQSEGIPFGCIAVLSQANAERLGEIYRFFEERKITFRLLPIYRTGYAHQQDSLALSDPQIVDGLRQVVDLWFASEQAVGVEPILTYIRHVARYMGAGSKERAHYNKRQSELVYIVDTDGGVYSNADAYDAGFCYGNIFTHSLRELRRSEGRHRAIRSAHRRMAMTCNKCRFHGTCSGFYMAEATPEQRHLDEFGRLQCATVKPVQDYIEQKFLTLGLLTATSGRLSERKLRTRLGSARTEAILG